MKCLRIVAVFMALLMIGCQEEAPLINENVPEAEIAEYLPFQEFVLQDVSEFTTVEDNWKIVGNVSSDFQLAWDIHSSEGSGILVNMVEDQGKRDQEGAAKGAHLLTKLEHGDIELELEVLVPKESNSGLYFQSRYELQIRDTAEDEDLSPDDMGGIYNQRKDNKSVPGSAPAINAARAPGLWQKYKILFRAPTFDIDGNKLTNARFEHVYLNGYLIQENVDVLSPTIEAPHSDEVVRAPLMIQGDHGPVAFRNIRYKLYDKMPVQLSNISYKLYDGKFDYIPDFSKLEIVKEGRVGNFDNLSELSEKNEGYSIVFEGDLEIPTDGMYLFETRIDDGGDLYINDTLLVHNEGEPGFGIERGVIKLTKGVHRLRQSYFQEVWGAVLLIFVEGPNIEKGELPALLEPRPIPNWARDRHLQIEIGDEPELIRGFVNHNGVKKTHILSVGTPQGIHFSYDTRNNELINLWKGQFADVANMWINRGESQRLDAVAAALGLEENKNKGNCKPLGYTLDATGIPVFNYSCNGMIISDRTGPADAQGMARREIAVDSGKYQYVVASGDSIFELSNGWYSVGNNYFIKPAPGSTECQVVEDQIVANITNSSKLTYEIYW